MLEVFGEHYLGELFLVEDDEADAGRCPSNGIVILVVLDGGSSTFRSS